MVGSGKYSESNPLRVFTTFSGYDSQCLALRKAGIPFDLIGWSEIDRKAILAHNLLFPEYAGRNYGDVSKIDWSLVPDFDFFTYSSPCTNFSISGLQTGGDEGSGTKSALLWETKKAIELKRPKYMMMENVKNMVSDRFIHTFNSWLEYLESQGYSNWWSVLNSCDFGVPQDRKRVFCISILNPSGEFVFPNGKILQRNVQSIMQTKSEMGETMYQNVVIPVENYVSYLDDNEQFRKFAVEQK